MRTETHTDADIDADIDADDGALRLDDQLCFALYAATNAITRAYRPRLGELGLTYPQYLVMLSLWQHGTEPVGRIAARLELDSHAVTPLVRRLETAGLVGRRRTADRRVVLVALTPAGRDLEQSAAAAQAEVACATGLDPWALAALRRELRELSARLTHDPRTDPHQAGRTSRTEGAVS